MLNEPITLSELAERSGIEMRTLRSWIQQGLLPGPDSAGRNASYPPAALMRARAVKAMREIYGLPLSAIRQDLLAADEERIAAYAAMAGAAPPAGPGEQAALIPAPPPSSSTAADYLRSLRSAGVYGAEPAPARPPHPAGPAAQPPPSVSRLARLAEGLKRIAGPRPSRRKAKGDVRLHIAITPDIELTVRGEQSPEEVARFEQVADLLRVILSGGADHD